MTWLKVFDIVPGWVYALAIVAVTVGGAGGMAVVAHQRDAARLNVAQLGKQISDEKAERERVAREDAQEVARIQSRHAAMQQEITNESTKRETARIAADTRLRADNERLRADILAAPRRGDESEVDAAACRRDGDLSRQLARDLAEAVGLQSEAETVIRRRDDEVRRLLEQIRTDRKAVE